MTVYPLGSNGNVTPVEDISGSDTNIYSPEGVAVDPSGNIYVVNYTNEINVFAAGASGNAVPVQTIKGSRTKMSACEGIALNPVNGDIYIVNYDGSSVTFYAGGSNGNVAPLGEIAGDKANFGLPTGVTLDPSGTIYVSGLQTGIDIFSAGSDGNVAPKTIIEGSRTPPLLFSLSPSLPYFSPLLPPFSAFLAFSLSPSSVAPSVLPPRAPAATVCRRAVVRRAVRRPSTCAWAPYRRRRHIAPLERPPTDLWLDGLAARLRARCAPSGAGAALGCASRGLSAVRRLGVSRSRLARLRGLRRVSGAGPARRRVSCGVGPGLGRHLSLARASAAVASAVAGPRAVRARRAVAAALRLWAAARLARVARRAGSGTSGAPSQLGARGGRHDLGGRHSGRCPARVRRGARVGAVRRSRFSRLSSPPATGMPPPSYWL